MVENMSLLASTFRSAHADGEPMSRSTFVRALAMVALAPIVTGLLATAALLTLILAIATSSNFSTEAVLSTTGPVWLAAYQVPLEVDGAPLGVLPLVPTVLVCVLIARAASGAAQRLGCATPDRALLLIGVVAAAHAVVGVVVALLSGDAFITADPLTAVFVPALVSGLAVTVGVAKPCGLTTMARRYLDPLAVAGLRAGALGLAGLVAAGALTLLLTTALSASTVADLFAEVAPGAGSATGLWLVSLGYVPNAVGLAMGFATGPGLQLGAVEVGPVSFTGGGVPPFPLLGALPDEQALWWPVLMLLPAAVGTGVGWWLRTCHEDPMARLRTVGVAGALVGFGTVVVGFLAGGRLATGPFDPVGIPLGIVSIAAFLWIAVPGALVAWFAGARPAAAEDDAVDDAEDAAEDDAVADAEAGAEDEVAEAVDPDDDEIDEDVGTDDEDPDDEDSDTEQPGDPGSPESDDADAVSVLDDDGDVTDLAEPDEEIDDDPGRAGYGGDNGAADVEERGEDPDDSDSPEDADSLGGGDSPDDPEDVEDPDDPDSSDGPEDPDRPDDSGGSRSAGGPTV